MAKTNVELQHLMTSSYSGGSVKDNDRDQQSSTVFNATPPDTYSTITDAQKEHAQYNSHQVRNPEGSVTSSNPSGGPPYEYDIIPPAGEETKRGMLESVREDGGSGGGVTVRGGSTKPGSFRHEAKNIMYEENELKPEKMQHRSLRADSYRTYTGAVYQEPRESYVTCRCKAQNLIVSFFIVMAILFSVASLVLSVLLWFGIYGGASSSDCSCPGRPTHSHSHSLSPSPSPSLSHTLSHSSLSHTLSLTLSLSLSHSFSLLFMLRDHFNSFSYSIPQTLLSPHSPFFSITTSLHHYITPSLPPFKAAFLPLSFNTHFLFLYNYNNTLHSIAVSLVVYSIQLCRYLWVEYPVARYRSLPGSWA